jgi:type IV pilus assembly protein PilC
MPQFHYQGRDRNGNKRTGTLYAESRHEALKKLRQQNINVFDLPEVPNSWLTKEITFGQRVKYQDFVVFLRQFSTLLKAGVSVVDSINILAKQTESKTLKKVLVDIEEDLRSGNPLSTAAERHKRVFSPMFINMVKAGETGGNMDETLERLANYFEKQYRTRQKVVSALAYPAFIGFAMLAIVIFLLTFVVPTFVDMFIDFGAELPPITKFVLSASEFMKIYWWVVFLSITGIVLLLAMLKKQKRGKYFLDYIVLKMPIFGNLIQKAEIARMTRTLSSLFSSSVPILNALRIVENVVENEVIARVLSDAHDSLEGGNSLAEPFQKHWAFPPVVSQMIAIGETTGALDSMLSKVADFYEAEVEAATERLKALIEPVMIVLLAGVVGTIVTAILVPMYEIFNHIETQ